MNESDVLRLRIVLSDRYRLLRPIATGGMAEIFLARQKALAGFEKDVAVKLLRDRYRGDPRVVEMFLNEARIGAVLSHPNIVHVYDVGEHDKQPFIAMEYIAGEELSQLCRRGLELARFLPLEHAVDLVRQAAEALGYVHAKRDESGHPLDIVHRDISPSNLLITHDGVLKIIDFGIARATWADRRESEGADKLVPGKYNYMSPEQVRGERVDHRSDIFSLGIVLYEITVGKRLFKGRPEEVMQKVTRGRIKPPTFIRRQFPPALERIVMKALEAHRDDRYGSAYELAHDLEEFLRDSGLKSGPVRIAQYLDELRAAAGAERRPELIIAGEAWLDDDGEEALDFDRGFSLAPARERPPAGVGKAREETGPRPKDDEGRIAAGSSPVPKVEAAVEKVERIAAPPPPPADADEEPADKAAEPGALTVPVPTVAPAAPANDDEEILASVAEKIPSSETRPLRAVKLDDEREEETSVHGASRIAPADIDPDLGTEDSPTDASIQPPDMPEPTSDFADRPPAILTLPIVLAEPTGQVPLTLATGRTPLLRAETAMPLRAEPTGKVTRVPAPVVPPPAPGPSLLSPEGRAAADAERLAALDPSGSTDTPLPPVIDPATVDDTARHPLADLESLVAATGLKLLRADPPAPEARDAAVAPAAESPAPARAPRANGKKKGKHKVRRGYRPRSMNIEITPDLVAPVAFGDGVIQTRSRGKIPWPLVSGAVLVLLAIVLLMTQ